MDHWYAVFNGYWKAHPWLQAVTAVLVGRLWVQAGIEELRKKDIPNASLWLVAAACPFGIAIVRFLQVHSWIGVAISTLGLAGAVLMVKQNLPQNPSTGK